MDAPVAGLWGSEVVDAPAADLSPDPWGNPWGTPPSGAAEQVEPLDSEATAVEGTSNAAATVDAALTLEDAGEAPPNIGAPPEAAEAGEVIELEEPIETRTDSDGKVWVPKDAYDDAKEEADRHWNALWDLAEEEQRAEVLADVAEDVGESTVDFVEGIPFVGEDIGGALREGYDVVEDVVDHADDPGVQDVDPWG